MTKNNDRVVQILAEAAAEADEANNYNKATSPHIRCSRAGLPLIQQVVEDKIISKLPHQENNFWKAKEEDEFSLLSPNQSQMKFEMAIAQGYLFERVVAWQLQQAFPKAFIQHNVDLEFEGLGGHCDFLVINEEEKQAIVIECKAIGAFSEKEAREKVLSDNYGYFTQLSLYQAAIHKQLPDYEVRGEWRVWNKRQDQALTIPYELPFREALKVANKASKKAELYERACSLFDQQKTDELIHFLFNFSDPFPPKKQTRAYYLGTCSFHFSPWCSLLLNEKGEFNKQASNNLRLMIQAALGEEKALQNILKKIRGAS
jgi:hypothetical protein